MRAVALAALLLQEPDLTRELKATRPAYSELAMITLIARYPDGSPVRGEIRCAGDWFKHQDHGADVYGTAMPFTTDSRGAVIMNPHVDDGWITCWSDAKGYSGKVTVDFDRDRPTGVYEIAMEKAPDAY